MSGESYGLSVLTPPAEPPVDLVRAKRHLRIDHDDEDALISGWIDAATRLVEDFTGRRLVAQSLRLTLARWPRCGVVRMPVEPVTAIVEFTYLDSAGAEQTLDPADYQAWLDHSPPLLAPDVLTAWPALQAGALKPITIDFTAGYGTAQAVPELVKAEILKTLADWDENRGRAGMELPESAKAGLMLLWTGGYR